MTIIDWDTTPGETRPGAKGTWISKTIEESSSRVRMIEYSDGFVADHWCSHGHVLLMLKGALSLLLRSGEQITVMAGQTLILRQDEKNPHKVTSERGARVFVVD